MYVVSAFRRTSREVRLKPDTTYYMEPKTALAEAERAALHVHDAAIEAAHGSDFVTSSGGGPAQLSTNDRGGPLQGGIIRTSQGPDRRASNDGVRQRHGHLAAHRQDELRADHRRIGGDAGTPFGPSRRQIQHIAVARSVSRNQVRNRVARQSLVVLAARVRDCEADVAEASSGQRGGRGAGRHSWLLQLRDREIGYPLCDRARGGEFGAGDADEPLVSVRGVIVDRFMTRRRRAAAADDSGHQAVEDERHLLDQQYE